MKSSSNAFSVFEALNTDLKKILKDPVISEELIEPASTKRIKKIVQAILNESRILNEKEWEERDQKYENELNKYLRLKIENYQSYQKEMRDLIEISRKKIHLALMGIKSRDPIVYNILTECPIIFTAFDGINTMAVDRAGNLYINPIFLNTILAPSDVPKIFRAGSEWSPEKFAEKELSYAMGVLAHECLHILNATFTRTPQKPKNMPPKFDIREAWNIATDYIMNETLLRCGYDLPPVACLPIRVNPSNPKKIDPNAPRSAVIFPAGTRDFPKGAITVNFFDEKAPPLIYPLDADIDKNTLHAQKLYAAILEHAQKYPVNSQDQQSQNQQSQNQQDQQKQQGQNQNQQSQNQNQQDQQDQKKQRGSKQQGQQNQQGQQGQGQNQQSQGQQGQGQGQQGQPDQQNQQGQQGQENLPDSDQSKGPASYKDEHIYDDKKPQAIDTGEETRINEKAKEASNEKEADEIRKNILKRAMKKTQSSPSQKGNQRSGDLITLDELKNAVTPGIDWKQLIKDALTMVANKKITNNNLIDINKTIRFSPLSPGGRKIVPIGKKIEIKNPSVPNVTIAIDTSGSISQPELLSIIKSIFNLLEELKDKDVRIRVLLWTTEVYFDCAFSTAEKQIWIYDFKNNNFKPINNEKDAGEVLATIPSDSNDSKNNTSSTKNNSSNISSNFNINSFNVKKINIQDVGNIFLQLINTSFSSGGTAFRSVKKHLDETSSKANSAIKSRAPWIFKIMKLFIFTDCDVEPNITHRDIPQTKRPPVIILADKNKASLIGMNNLSQISQNELKIELYDAL